MESQAPITELNTAEALEFLSSRAFRRLAISLQCKPDIFPVNFPIHAQGDDGVAYICTSPGNKLCATAIASPLALEADSIQDSAPPTAPEETATSVIVDGVGRLVRHPKEFDLVETLGLQAWIAARKPDVVAIDVEHISGRKFLLGPGPETTIAETPD